MGLKRMIIRFRQKNHKLSFNSCFFLLLQGICPDIVSIHLCVIFVISSIVTVLDKLD